MGSRGVKGSWLEPLHRTWAGACLVHVVLILAWVFGGGLVVVNCAFCADYTYGLSFIIFVNVAFSGVNTRRAWAAACIMLFAWLGPRTVEAPGFWRYWFALVFLTFQVWVVWFPTIAPQPWLWRLFYDMDYPKYYSACELHGELEDINKEGSLFGFHPHGMLCIGFSLNGIWSKRFQDHAGEGTQFLVDKVLREDNPVFKILCDAHGNLNRCDKGMLWSLMAKNKNVAFPPGGFEEATYMAYGEQRAYIKKRVGFIKYALQHGYRVHPVWTFGESHTYRCLTGGLDWRLWLNKFGIPAVTPFGMSWFPLLPLPEARIMTCVGKSIQFPKIASPSDAEIQEWHAKYIEGLKHTFESNKKAVGYVDAKLEIY